MPWSSKDMWKQENFRISRASERRYRVFQINNPDLGSSWETVRCGCDFYFFKQALRSHRCLEKSFNLCKLYLGKISSAPNNNWKPMAKWIPFRPQRLDDSSWGGQREKCSSLWHKDAKVDVKTTCLPLIFTHLFKLMRLYLGKENEIYPQTIHSFLHFDLW